MIRKFFLFAILLCGLSLHAQRVDTTWRGPARSEWSGTWSIKGLVCDSATKNPVPGARVSVYATCTLETLSLLDDSLVWSGTADSLGKFTINDIELPSFYCQFRFIPEAAGYKLPQDRCKHSTVPRGKSSRTFDMSATVWMKRDRSLRLVPTDED